MCTALVVCDIAPLGIAVARAAGIQSILIENFTWDWIYRAYARSAPRLEPVISYLRSVFRSVDHHIQTEPVCNRRAADLVTSPVSRPPRTARRQIREQLGIPPLERVVLVTHGRVPQRHAYIDRLVEMPGVWFIIAGGSRQPARHGNAIILPQRSGYYHPDLVNASDAVVGKSGYSTLAEVYHAGIPFGFVSRRRFPEARVVARFIERKCRDWKSQKKNSPPGMARCAAALAVPAAPAAHASKRRRTRSRVCTVKIASIN